MGFILLNMIPEIIRNMEWSLVPSMAWAKAIWDSSNVLGDVSIGRSIVLTAHLDVGWILAGGDMAIPKTNSDVRQLLGFMMVYGKLNSSKLIQTYPNSSQLIRSHPKSSQIIHTSAVPLFLNGPRLGELPRNIFHLWRPRSGVQGRLTNLAEPKAVSPTADP